MITWAFRVLETGHQRIEALLNGQPLKTIDMHLDALAQMSAAEFLRLLGQHEAGAGATANPVAAPADEPEPVESAS